MENNVLFPSLSLSCLRAIVTIMLPDSPSECLMPESSPLSHIPLIYIDRTIDSAAIVANYPYTDLLSYLLFSILQIDVAVK